MYVHPSFSQLKLHIIVWVASVVLAMGMHDGAREVHQQPLHIIDMAAPDKHATAARVRTACMSSGFFYVVNHGVDAKLVEEVFAQSKKFFSLPTEEKLKMLHDKNFRGYTPFGIERFDPTASKPDSKEGYSLGVHVPESDPNISKPLHAPNKYPPPDLLPGWQETIDEYLKELTKLAHTVARMLALALGVEETYFEKPGIIDDALAYMKLVHYSAEKSNVELGTYGCGAHCDYGMLTLLATDDAPGLQVCKNKDEETVWEDIPPMKGYVAMLEWLSAILDTSLRAFIVNLGDMIEMWSNGLFRSPLHRVVGQGVERYSTPFFFHPNYDCLVECLPTCVSEDNPPKYPPITCEGHMMRKFYPVAKEGDSGEIQVARSK